MQRRLNGVPGAAAELAARNADGVAPRLASAVAVLVVCLFTSLVTSLVASNAQALAIGSIHIYQRALAPAAARIGMRCRFTPTCSRYAETVIARDGVVRGGLRTLKRIARCGPWTASGTRDEP